MDCALPSPVVSTVLPVEDMVIHLRTDLLHREKLRESRVFPMTTFLKEIGAMFAAKLEMQSHRPWLTELVLTF